MVNSQTCFTDASSNNGAEYPNFTHDSAQTTDIKMPPRFEFKPWFLYF